VRLAGDPAHGRVEVGQPEPIAFQQAVLGEWLVYKTALLGTSIKTTS